MVVLYLATGSIRYVGYVGVTAISAKIELILQALGILKDA